MSGSNIVPMHEFKKATPIIVIDERQRNTPLVRAIRRELAERRREERYSDDENSSDRDSPAEESDDEDKAVVAVAPRLQDTPISERVAQFWIMLMQLEWRNSSDERMTAGRVNRFIRGLTPDQRDIFADRYAAIYDELLLHLTASRMSQRKNITADGDRAKIVSHFIAMGRDVYETIKESSDLCEYFIDAGECQSLDNLLPYDMQH